ncbi:transposable element Tcb2 transposase [Trichonephila clavipes]|nr:transposable element Tcb2 transposase [Trichonephila clavipes]
MQLQKRRSGDQCSEQTQFIIFVASVSESVREIWLEEITWTIHRWKNDRKAGRGAYRHQCSCTVQCHFARFESAPNHRYICYKVGGRRPRTTTSGDDQYIILQAKRDRRQSESAIALQLSTATGRQVSRFTVARRLHKEGLFARCPERCLPFKVDHRRHRLH